MLDGFNEMTRYLRVIPAIKVNKKSELFWLVYFIAIGYIFFLVLCFIYLFYSAAINKFYLLWPLKVLQNFLLLLFWIFYDPFMEAFFEMLKCSDNYNEILTSMECYTGLHIFLAVLSILFIIILFLIAIFYALFNNENNTI